MHSNVLCPFSCLMLSTMMYINTCVHVLQYVNNFMILIAVMVNLKKNQNT